MTRRSSVRAQARRIYRDSTQASEARTPTPNPSPQGGGEKSAPQGGGEQAGAGESSQTNLTARARALYEDSAVPVREIAKLAGVTERTIYKYAAKHAWKPRYRWSPDRGWRARAPFAPAKGAGARFIRREDKGRPFATRLKAFDPAGAARAAAECEEAERVARAAQAEADYDFWAEQAVRALEKWSRALCALIDYRNERKTKGGWPGPGEDSLEVAYRLAVDMARDDLNYASTERGRALERVLALQRGSPSPFQGEVEARTPIGKS